MYTQLFTPEDTSRISKGTKDWKGAGGLVAAGETREGRVDVPLSSTRPPDNTIVPLLSAA